MQIACKKYSCQKAVEVCYWSCKYRRDCKDWHGALDAIPGTDAIAERLSAAAQKSGRVFDPQTMVLTSRSKRKRAAIISKSPSAPLQSAGTSAARKETPPSHQPEPISHKTRKNNRKEVKRKMTEDNLDTPTAENSGTTEGSAEASTKAATKAKPKPAAKPKPVGQPNGPVYLLLYANGKYKELRESELNTEAAGVLKDPSLRLIKGQALIPQISFRTADE